MSNLGMEQKGNNILKNINLEIKIGEFIFLIGESGSGKTALLELIQGRRMYNSGSLKINDKELSQYDYRELQKLRRTMGIIFQDTRLVEEWTVFDNITYKLEFLGYPFSLIQSNLERVTVELGVDKKVRSLPKNLSGGERQRANIARAIIGDPQIIIADEPTSNLDRGNSKKVFEILKKQNKAGATVIMTTHDPYFIEKSNFRVVKLAKGEKVYDQSGSNYFV
ncbi:ATP-binding cassette domain-containing protein [Enterococcus durans]|nr:ATP-binding cassette domain-containing protein [Enterococcus durans]RYT06187.1 ATP-binding cassette domain-containing protein [Enterococcus durans]